MRDRRSPDDAVILANKIIFPIAANFAATKGGNSLSLSLSLSLSRSLIMQNCERLQYSQAGNSYELDPAMHMRSSPEKQKIARLLETHIQSIILHSRNPKSLLTNFLKLALIQDYSTQEYIIETHQNCPKPKTKKQEGKKKLLFKIQNTIIIMMISKLWKIIIQH
jgi:hypothetical protein